MLPLLKSITNLSRMLVVFANIECLRMARHNLMQATEMTISVATIARMNILVATVARRWFRRAYTVATDNQSTEARLN